MQNVILCISSSLHLPSASSQVFARLVFHGKIKAAMCFLTEQSWGIFAPVYTS